MGKTSNSLGGKKAGGWISALFLTLLVLAGLSALRLTPEWRVINGHTFDRVSIINSALPEEPGIIIVAIDEPSLGQIDQQWPWPRELHGKLLEALRSAGAKAVALDIVFDSSSRFGEGDDNYLALAARADTIFATEEVLLETPQARSFLRNEPLAVFLANGARTGRANVQPDGDGVVRTLPDSDDNFMQELLMAVGERPPFVRGDRLIQYFGPHNTYPRVSYYQALDPDNFLPPDFFKDKVVIVGYSLQASPDIGTRDAFETPYTAVTGYYTPGVEVQATIYDNFRTGLSIYRPPNGLGYILLALGCFLGFVISRAKKPLLEILGMIVVLGMIIVLAWLALRYGRIWVSPWDMGTGLVAVIVVLSARDFAMERRQRRAIQGAFAQYLSPAMVNRIIEDPDRLNLGGERRNLTIMFADIRGFTGLSEGYRDDPQGLTSLINEILTPLADIVMANGGTIDKFIGDCIMAFWNAPLDDPDHAENGLKAAREMVAALDGINEQISAIAGPDRDISIRIGVGLNTGDCVVGNMGSKSRFDYSVLGDAVNVAARLEGLSKTYETDIVFGENTFNALKDTSGIRELDTVQVKGRAEPLKIYTLL